MSNQFHQFKVAVQKRFNHIKGHQLFRAQIEGDVLWETYLSSFPEGTNPLFRERTEHDCSCCKSFIRSVGSIVAVVDGELKSIWEVQVDGFYQVVADALAAKVKEAAIENIFLHRELRCGVDHNYELGENGKSITWEHFQLTLESAHVARGEDLGTKLGNARTAKEVLGRALTDISREAAESVLELIAQNSLYRGQEHKFAVETFLRLKKKLDQLQTERQRDLFCWAESRGTAGSVTGIRNTVIGSLLTDLSEGRELEAAVGAYEAKVAPTNYKRPTALITKAMVEQAHKTIAELGLTDALERRFATIDDITINNILFANRTAKRQMNVMEELAAVTAAPVQKLEKVEEVTIERFVGQILPKVESVELLFENRHAGNLVSLIAPVHGEAKGMFKWDNAFSWSYAGSLADSIKERVKSAGGKVDGDLRCSLSWYNSDDLDLHMTEPDGTHIFYGDKRSHGTGGHLDVDMNAGGPRSRTPVENICHPNKARMKEGKYLLTVNNFNRRESIDTGFEVEVEFDGTIYSFTYAKPVRDKETIKVAEITYSHKTGFSIKGFLPEAQTSRQLWGLPTQTFHKVNVLMYSPNHWDEKAVGNRHYFFMLDNCLNDGQARGFFNEFLTEELNSHRKVFEVVGSKIKVEESERQLSGLGFSDTQRNYVLCRVKGNFTRTIKIVF